MSEIIDKYREKVKSLVPDKLVKLNPLIHENQKKFNSFIKKKWNIVEPFLGDMLGIIAVLIVIYVFNLCCLGIAEHQIIDRVTNFVESNGLSVTILSLGVIICLATIVLKWSKFKSSVSKIVKNNIWLLALVLLYLLFYPFWESLIGKHIIAKFLCNFHGSDLNDIIFGLAVVCCCTLCYFNRNKNIKQSTIVICVIALTFWSYYRFCNNRLGIEDEFSYYLHLEELRFDTRIKYVDLIPIYAICTVFSPLLGKLLHIILYRRKNENTNNAHGFERDVPIDSSKDNYMRHVQAEDATNQLLKTDTAEGSFTYGIDAPWGSGKTSFMNMMKEYINENENIIIDFNPWLYSEGKDLVSIFFDELSKNLKRYDKSLAKNIIDYSKILSAFNTDETTIIASLLDLFNHDVTFQEKKSQIEGTLKRINKKIFVFVDDLDRLDADELMEMMKLIRNVSDFPNMYFVAAYDKKYLIQCLNTKMPTKGADFIEKVFTQEFHLPPYPQINTSLDLYNYISPLLSEDEQIALSNYITENNYDNSLPIISNLRETKRLANSIISNYSFNKMYFKNHRIIGFVILEYFKIKYPLAFTFFESNWEKMMDSQEINDRTYLTLYSGDNNNMYLKINFLEYIEANREDFCINDADILSIKRLLTLLFGNKGFIDDHDLLSHYFNPTLY